MLLYHRTHAADDILRDGFRDGEDTYMTDVMLRGVWLSAWPLSIQEGAVGDPRAGGQAAERAGEGARSSSRTRTPSGSFWYQQTW